MAKPTSEAGFMLWEALAAGAVLAIVLQSALAVSLITGRAQWQSLREQIAQQWALSLAERLAAGVPLDGRVVLPEAMLPHGVACLRTGQPRGLKAIRWQTARSKALPSCEGGWPAPQQLCLLADDCQ